MSKATDRRVKDLMAQVCEATGEVRASMFGSEDGTLPIKALRPLVEAVAQLEAQVAASLAKVGGR